ncbi:MAG: CoA transferase [Ilumatobacteraceae bacterium]|nr:CoA transferase [Ilumatobacteraceae bacterium]
MGALDGIKVLEAGLLVQGPQAAALLGDWGADVVKIELPIFGDQSRWLPIAPGDGRAPFFIGCNRGKRSVTIDLRVPEGRDAFLALAEQADVFISNFKSGTLDEWGLSYEAVSARNPRLIYAAGTSFGTEGPGAGREGADLSAQAAGGLISTTGVDGEPVSPIAVTICDHIASLNIAAGVSAALYARERTGRGQRIDVSLLGGQVWAQASELTAAALSGVSAGRSNRGHPLIPGIYGVFPTNDGWIALVGVAGADRNRFFDLVGRTELAAQFPGPLYFGDTKRDLFAAIEVTMRTRSTADWCALFTEHRIRHAPVRTHAEVVTDPDVWANGYMRRGADGQPVVASAVRFSDTPARTGEVAPELGQHTEEVLLDAGFTWDDITALRDAGAI